MVIERVRQMSVEEYLAFEEGSDIKHEYIEGETYPMTGGSWNHTAIKVNLISALTQLLRGRDCRVCNSDMRLRVARSRFVYPDISVVCGKPMLEYKSLTLLNPILVAEVTSPSSIDYDRGSKRQLYSEAPSIAAYLVIDQHRPLVELYTRAESGWHIQCFAGLKEAVPLEALGCRLPLSEIYASVDFDAEASASAEEAE